MSASPSRIHLKLRDLAQLFNSLDPSPFLERDLDHDAEEFMVSWARESPKEHGFELVIQLATAPEPERAMEIEEAIQHYFSSRAEIKLREFRLLLRRGHASLLIGLLFPGSCLVARGLAANLGYPSAAGVAREGRLIAGWVAMWRPLEIYLYDWWPLRAEWRNLQRLAHMRVRLIPPRPRESDSHQPQPAVASAH